MVDWEIGFFGQNLTFNIIPIFIQNKWDSRRWLRENPNKVSRCSNEELLSVESDPPQSIHRDPIRPLVTPLVLSVINLHLLEMASLVVSLALGEIYFHSTLAFCQFWGSGRVAWKSIY